MALLTSRTGALPDTRRHPPEGSRTHVGPRTVGKTAPTRVLVSVTFGPKAFERRTGRGVREGKTEVR